MLSKNSDDIERLMSGQGGLMYVPKGVRSAGEHGRSANAILG